MKATVLEDKDGNPTRIIFKFNDFMEDDLEDELDTNNVTLEELIFDLKNGKI